MTGAQPGRCGERLGAQVCVAPWHAGTWSQFDDAAPFPATTAYLDATAGRIPGTPLSFLLREAGVPVAGLHGTVIADAAPYEVFNLHHVVVGPAPMLPLHPESRPRRAGLAQRTDPADWSPSLVVMYPSYECFAVGAAAHSPAHMDQLVRGVVDWAADADIRAVAFLYVPSPPDGPLSALALALRAAGFDRIPLSYACTLPLTGAAFDDYLRSLPAGRRGDVRRELRALDRSGISFGVRPLRDCFDDVVRLRCALVRKYRGAAQDGAERGRLRQIAALWTEHEIGVFQGSLPSAMLGFALFHGYRGTWYPYWTGADYDHPRHRLVYFQTLYYEPIRLALDAGATMIDYGQGSWAAKRSRGCDLTPMDGWVMPLRAHLRPITAASAACTELVR